MKQSLLAEGFDGEWILRKNVGCREKLLSARRLQRGGATPYYISTAARARASGWIPQGTDLRACIADTPEVNRAVPCAASDNRRCRDFSFDWAGPAVSWVQQLLEMLAPNPDSWPHGAIMRTPPRHCPRHHAALAIVALAMIACSPQQAPRQQSTPQDPAAVQVSPGPTPPNALGQAPRPPGAGFIECGPTRCDARASACIRLAGKPAKCVSKAERDGYARGGGMDDAVLDCDDDTDCPSGQHCCTGQYWGGTGPHIHLCSAERCDDSIACIPATGCPANLKCVPVGSSADSHCAPSVAGTTCGKVRCSGATPVCCWNSATNQGSCVAEPGRTAACTGDDENRIRCRGRADCGGYDCCHFLARSTDCASTCPGAAVGVACLTMADCPAEGPGPAGVRQRYERCENGACTGRFCNPQGQWIPCDSM